MGDIWVKSARFHGWNPPDFRVKSPTLHSSNWRVFAETLAFIILGGFHRWNLPDFTGEIHQISGWNVVDFKGEIPHPAFIKLKCFCWNTCFYNFGWISQVKSTRFQGEMWWISRVKSPTLHSSNWRVFAETLAFIILGGFHRWYLGEIRRISRVKSAGFHGFHEIRRISQWNPPDFTDFTDFMKSAGFHGWNPPDFIGEIRRISRISWNPPDFTVKSAGFHGFHEIRRISWNPPDFTGEIRRISRISWMWAFGRWSSIGLSIERPNNAWRPLLGMPNTERHDVT